MQKTKKVNFTEDSELQIIKRDAFKESSIESILIPSKVITIESGAFDLCSNLTKVEFAENSHLCSIG